MKANLVLGFGLDEAKQKFQLNLQLKSTIGYGGIIMLHEVRLFGVCPGALK